MESMVERDPSLRDFYNDYDPYKTSDAEIQQYNRSLRSLGPEQKAQLAAGDLYYQLDFSNLGGLVMPLVIQFEFEDGETLVERVPVDIWKKNNLKTSKVFRFQKKLVSIHLDPYLETADCDTNNNHWPPELEESRFELYRRSQFRRNASNPMQQVKD
jgi:hypothetical protein